MRIAVASEGLDVSLHGGRCASYMCYTVDRGIVAECQNLPNPGLPPADTAQLLADLGVSLFMAHEVDPDFQAALEGAGIEIVTGAFGSTRRSVEAFIADMFTGHEGLDDDSEPTPLPS